MFVNLKVSVFNICLLFICDGNVASVLNTVWFVAEG